MAEVHFMSNSCPVCGKHHVNLGFKPYTGCPVNALEKQ